MTHPSRLVALTALMLAASAASARAAEPRLTVTDDADRRQVVIAGGPFRSGDEASTTAARDLLLHRHEVSVFGRSAGATWTVVVFRQDVGGTRTDLVSLTSERPAAALARPLGFEIRAGDVLGIRITAPEGAELELVLIADYEVPGSGASRIAISPLGTVRVLADSPSHGAAAGWTLRADADGRLLALGGISARGGELTVRDDASGDVVFRQASRGGEAFAPSGDVIRIGIQLRAGRTYTISVSADDQRGAAAERLQALVLNERQDVQVARAR